MLKRPQSLSVASSPLGSPNSPPLTETHQLKRWRCSSRCWWRNRTRLRLQGGPRRWRRITCESFVHVASLGAFDAILNWTARKHAVETVEMLDFLKEIVEPVPDPSAGGTINLEAEDNNSGGEPKKRRAPKGKKPATGDDEDGGAPAPKRRRRRKKEEEAEDVAMGGTGGADEDEE